MNMNNVRALVGEKLEHPPSLFWRVDASHKCQRFLAGRTDFRTVPRIGYYLVAPFPKDVDQKVEYSNLSAEAGAIKIGDLSDLHCLISWLFDRISPDRAASMRYRNRGFPIKYRFHF